MYFFRFRKLHLNLSMLLRTSAKNMRATNIMYSALAILLSSYGLSDVFCTYFNYLVEICQCLIVVLQINMTAAEFPPWENFCHAWVKITFSCKSTFFVSK